MIARAKIPQDGAKRRPIYSVNRFSRKAGPPFFPPREQAFTETRRQRERSHPPSLWDVGGAHPFLRPTETSGDAERGRREGWGSPYRILIEAIARGRARQRGRPPVRYHNARHHGFPE